MNFDASFQSGHEEQMSCAGIWFTHQDIDYWIKYHKRKEAMKFIFSFN